MKSAVAAARPRRRPSGELDVAHRSLGRRIPEVGTNSPAGHGLEGERRHKTARAVGHHDLDSQPRSTSRRTSSGAFVRPRSPPVTPSKHSRRIASFGRHRGSLQGDGAYARRVRPCHWRIELFLCPRGLIGHAPSASAAEDGGFFTRRSVRVSLSQWPRSERPRERLLGSGPASLSDGELLAVLLGTGSRGENVADLARRLLESWAASRRYSARARTSSRGRAASGPRVPRVSRPRSRSAAATSRRHRTRAARSRRRSTRPDSSRRGCSICRTKCSVACSSTRATV